MVSNIVRRPPTSFFPKPVPVRLMTTTGIATGTIPSSPTLLGRVKDFSSQNRDMLTYFSIMLGGIWGMNAVMSRITKLEESSARKEKVVELETELQYTVRKDVVAKLETKLETELQNTVRKDVVAKLETELKNIDKNTVRKEEITKLEARVDSMTEMAGLKAENVSLQSFINRETSIAGGKASREEPSTATPSKDGGGGNGVVNKEAS